MTVEPYVKSIPIVYPLTGIPGSSHSTRVQVKGVGHDPFSGQVMILFPIGLYPTLQLYCTVAPYCVSPSTSVAIALVTFGSLPQSTTAKKKNIKNDWLIDN